MDRERRRLELFESQFDESLLDQAADLPGRSETDAEAMRNGTVYRRHTVGPEGTLHAHDPASPVDPEGPCLGLAVIDAHDALMAPQVARMPRPPVPGEVCRRPEHHDPEFAEMPGSQARIRQITNSHRQVEAFLEKEIGRAHV